MVLVAMELTEMNCRTCFRKCTENDEIITGGISARYRLLTGFQMKPDDFLKRICAGCLQDLKRLAMFRDKCGDTERKLMQLLLPKANVVDPQEPSQTKIKTERVYDDSQDYQCEPALDIVKFQPEIDMQEVDQSADVQHQNMDSVKDDDEDSSDYGIEPLEMGPVVEPSKKVYKPSKLPGTPGKKKYVKTSAVCDICGFHYQNRYALHRHREIHTRTEDDPKFGCHLCLTTNEEQERQRKAWYPTKVALKGHMRLYHLMKTEIPCPLCGLMFKTKFTLNYHHFSKHVDPKEYPLECTTCHKRFFKQCILDKHAQYHGTKNYPCEICQALFYSKHNLKTHYRTVHSTDVFNCKFCDRTFNSKQYMYQHLKQHKQAYGCPICPGVSFGSNVTLKSHLQQYHPQLPLPPSRTKLHNHDWSHQLAQMNSFNP